jgi:hypothetical protein
MGGVHGQWLLRADVRGDVEGWGQGDITLETSAGEEGHAGRKGVERDASLVSAHVRFPSLIASIPEFGLLGLGYSWLGLGMGERGA